MTAKYKKKNKTNTITLLTTEIARLRKVLKDSECRLTQPRQATKDQQQVVFGLNYNCAHFG